MQGKRLRHFLPFAIMTPTASTSSSSHLPKKTSKERRAKPPTFVVHQPKNLAKADVDKVINQEEYEQKKISIGHLMESWDTKDGPSQQKLLNILLQQAQHANGKADFESEKNYHALQEDYHKVVNIASELIDCLEQLCKGKTIPPQLLSAISERLSSSTHISKNFKTHKKKSRMESSTERAQSRSLSVSPPPTPRSLKTPNASASKRIIRFRTELSARNGGQNNFVVDSPSIRLKKADSMGNILVPSDPQTSRNRSVVTAGTANAKICGSDVAQNASKGTTNTKTLQIPTVTPLTISDNNNNTTAFSPTLLSFKHSAAKPYKDSAINERNLATQKLLGGSAQSNAVNKQKAMSRNSTSTAQTYKNPVQMDTKEQSKAIEHPPCPVIESPLADCLNYTKISNHLVMNPNTRSSALLLQALRQQLTRTSSLIAADQNIQQFASKDILSLRNRKNSVLATILSQTEPATESKEELARFLNAIASFRTGRKYLLSIGQGKEMLYQVALGLRTKRLTHFAADQSLATLQKLSIRPLVQKELILSGMIEWLLLNYLDPSLYTSVGNGAASQKPSNLGMEFGTALLMNLCLNCIVSQSTVIRYKDQLLNLLTHLLTSKNIQLIPYVSGTLYCLLGAHSKFRQAARERDLETVLNTQITKVSSLEIQRQLGVVLLVLTGELEFDRKKKQADEEDEEEDYLEAEIDSTDTVIPTLTELFGETLLRRKYSTNCSTNSLPMHSAVKSLKEAEEESVPGTVPSRRNLLLVAPATANHRRSPQANKRRAGPNNGTTSSSVPVQQRRKGADSYAGDSNQSKKRQPITGAKGQRQLGQRAGDRAAVGQRQQSFVEEPCFPLRMVRFQEGLNRSNSMMSHATFVLENDKKKPLLVACGFREAVASYASKTARATPKFINESMIIEERHSSSQLTQSPSISAEPTPPILKSKHSTPNKPTPKPQNLITSPKKIVLKVDRCSPSTANKGQQPAWKDVDIDEPITLLHDHSNQKDLIEEHLAVVEGKMASTRIPDNADVQEYASIFGSRPKVIRTPESRALDKRQNTTIAGNGEMNYNASAHHLIATRH